MKKVLILAGEKLKKVKRSKVLLIGKALVNGNKFQKFSPMKVTYRKNKAKFRHFSDTLYQLDD